MSDRIQNAMQGPKYGSTEGVREEVNYRDDPNFNIKEIPLLQKWFHENHHPSRSQVGPINLNFWDACVFLLIKITAWC